jgi:hypothetical protein
MLTDLEVAEGDPPEVCELVPSTSTGRLLFDGLALVDVRILRLFCHRFTLSLRELVPAFALFGRVRV